VTLSGALEATATYGLADLGIRARVNLSYAAAAEDPQLAFRVAREGVELMQHLGMRGYGYYMLSNAVELAVRIGEWEWTVPQLEEAVQWEGDSASRLRLAEIRGLMGVDVSEEIQWVADLWADKTEVQAQASLDEVHALVALAQGDRRAALDLARRSYERNNAPDSSALQTASRAAAWIGEREALTDALAVLDAVPGRVSAATRREAGAALAALDHRRPEALAGFADAIRRWRELGLEFEAAVCGLNLVTMLGPSEPAARAAAEEVGVVFERLGALPFQKLLADAMSAPVSTPGSRPKAPPVQEVPASAARSE
jgi:hypothetical protein